MTNATPFPQLLPEPRLLRDLYSEHVGSTLKPCLYEAITHDKRNCIIVRSGHNTAALTAMALHMFNQFSPRTKAFSTTFAYGHTILGDFITPNVMHRQCSRLQLLRMFARDMCLHIGWAAKILTTYGTRNTSLHVDRNHATSV